MIEITVVLIAATLGSCVGAFCGCYFGLVVGGGAMARAVKQALADDLPGWPAGVPKPPKNTTIRSVG